MKINLKVDGAAFTGRDDSSLPVSKKKKKLCVESNELHHQQDFPAWDVYANTRTKVPPVLRREVPRKRSAGVREGVRKAEVSSTDLRIGTWNYCNRYVAKLSMRIVQNKQQTTASTSSTHYWSVISWTVHALES